MRRGEEKIQEIQRANIEKLRSEEATKREFMMLNQTIMVNEVRTKIMEKCQMM